MELDGAAKKLRKSFVNGLLALFKCYVNYYRYAKPKLSPAFNCEEESEILLSEFFKTLKPDDELFTYLQSTKKDILESQVSSRSHRVTFFQDETIPEEQAATSDEFVKTTSALVFPNIRKISSGLLNAYVDNLNEKEAESRTEALRKNRDTTSLTQATADALEKEKSVEPKVMVSLIDDRIDAVANKNNKKNKKKNKSKSRTKRTTDEHTSSNNTSNSTLTHAIDFDSIDDASTSTTSNSNKRVKFSGPVIDLAELAQPNGHLNNTIPPQLPPPPTYLPPQRPDQTIEYLQHQLHQLVAQRNVANPSQVIHEPYATDPYSAPSTFNQMNQWAHQYGPPSAQSYLASPVYSHHHPTSHHQSHHHGRGRGRGHTRGRGRGRGRTATHNSNRGRFSERRDGRGGSNRGGRGRSAQN